MPGCCLYNHRRIQKNKIQVERRAKDIILGKAYISATCRKYAEREKCIGAINYIYK